MVDKENQWEDMEYSEVNTTPQADNYSDDYEEDNYDTEEYSDDDTMENNQPVKKSNSAGVLILLLLIMGIIGGGAFFFLSKNNNANSPADNNITNNQPQNVMFQPEGNNPNNNGEMTVDFNNQDGSANVTNQAPNGEIVATVTDQPQENINIPNNDNNQNTSSNELNIPEPNNTIMVSYNPTARQNPFKPPVVNPEDDKEAYQQLNNTGFEVIEPPVTAIEDENLTRLLQTQISGILYDDKSPSAIVNLNGVDQFVKIGDVVEGYKIQNITRDKVQISYKNNSYVASVGELFVKGALEKQSTVANLESKFAGRYKGNNN